VPKIVLDAEGAQRRKGSAVFTLVEDTINYIIDDMANKQNKEENEITKCINFEILGYLKSCSLHIYEL